MYLMIEGAGGEELNGLILQEIQDGLCTKCLAPFDMKQPVIFVKTLSTLRILWWHRRNCARSR